mmetsp:Transcript_6637/g.20919  ORF Transcript_6637/g.20919 Transcript_6637/m.20919 type:complete len:194 (+) Transcript_6637:186-767(+)
MRRAWIAAAVLARSVAGLLFGPRIRRANVDDLDALAELRLEASPFAVGAASARRKNGESLRDLFCRGLESGDAACFLAVDRDQIVGYCDIARRQPLGRGLGKHAYLKNLQVLDAYRNRGLGEKLVRACLAHAAAEHADLEVVALEVDDGNGPAERLYERVGFDERASLGSAASLWRYSTFFLGRSLMFKQNVL